MKLTTRQLTLCALLTALALALSYLENLFPLSLAIPIPGVKLGLANIVTVFALYALGPGEALLILLARCFLGALFAGNMNALIFSLLGGLCAMTAMVGPPLPAAGAVSLWCVHRRRGGTQLRADCRRHAESGQFRPALLSACFAAGIPAYRRIDRTGLRLSVPGAPAH